MNTMRNQSGAFSALLISAVLLSAIIFAALACDIYHCVEVKAELQNATDAGALAGALDLWNNAKNASPDAYSITAMNFADGRSVSNSSNATTVSVIVNTPAAGNYGTVEVDATMGIRHFFAPIFGRFGDTVTVKSVAGSQGILQQVFSSDGTPGTGTAPIAVSWDTIPDNGPALSQVRLGSNFSLQINSQKVKNAAFTSLTAGHTNANWLQTAWGQLLGTQTAQPGFIPSVQVGDSIYLTNGVAEQKNLAKDPELSALLNAPPLVLPVIMGSPPLNQTAPIVGFIGFKVTGVTTNQGTVESINGTIVSPQVEGSSGQPSSSTPSGLVSMSPGPVQLIR